MSNPEMKPREEYGRRLSAARSAIARLDGRHRQLGNARLAVALAAVGVAWFAIGQRSIALGWLGAPVGLFVVLVVLHEVVVRRKERALRVAGFYEQGLARLEDRWAGTGETGERFLDPAHPYAADLDLFGRGSLFELLSTARTRMGEEFLAKWLLGPGTVEEIRERQAAVETLRGRLDLREDLAVLGQDVRVAVHPERLVQWAEARGVLEPRWLWIPAALLPVALTAATVGWFVLGWKLALLVALAAEGTFVVLLQPRVSRVLGEVEHAAAELDVLAELLGRLERERFEGPGRLAVLTRELELEGRSPSRQIARLRRLKEMVESRESLPVRPIRPFTLWGTNLAFAVERWRRESGPLVRRWLDAVGEMEALGALAGLAFERVGWVGAEVCGGVDGVDGLDTGGAETCSGLGGQPDLSTGGQAGLSLAVGGGAAGEGGGVGMLVGVGLRHPLLGWERAVENDVRLDSGMRLFLVSGSNMSGKSTLLRTVGINAVLALAGAPVCARRLRLSPMAIGASIRVTDSLQGGASRFYAEITRLKQILDLTQGKGAVLFLLDELLHGTNSHDRRIGGEAIVRGLVERGAMGLVTTHDLALAAIAESMGQRARNVHFQDRIEDGRMVFDFRLAEGVVTKSNAIELMRQVGLPL